MQSLYKPAHTRVFHCYFLCFLLRRKTKEVLALILKPGPKAVPVPSRHYDPALPPISVQLELRIHLQWGREGEGEK